MNARPYRSSRRAATAERTRERIIKAATALLAAPGGLSLDAAAKKAGVTRLTVYNQFGSRRALLEAVFDNIAERGRLHRISEAMRNPDPHEALQQIVAIFCDFWGQHREAHWRLQAASASDPEFQESLRARNERRRQLLSALVDRISVGDRKPPQVLSELIDVLFALTGLAFFSELAAAGYKTKAACGIIQALAADVLRRMLSENE
jgi:AcrR family transcriptional regulator